MARLQSAKQEGTRWQGGTYWLRLLRPHPNPVNVKPVAVRVPCMCRKTFLRPVICEFCVSREDKGSSKEGETAYAKVTHLTFHMANLICRNISRL